MNEVKFSIDPESGMLSDVDAKRYFSIVGFATGLFMLVYYVGGGALLVTLSILAPTWLENGIVGYLLNLVPLYGLAFPCFFLILRRLPTAPPAEGSLGFMGAVGGFCIAVVLMLAGNYVSNSIATLFLLLSGKAMTSPVDSMTAGREWWVNLIFLGILMPILEELIFRRFLCRRLLPLGEGYTVVLSAAILGLMHGNFFQFFYAFATGCVFAYVYVKTGKLRYSIFYHILINIVGGVLTPWLLEKLSPMMEESFIEQIMTLAEAGNYEEWAELVTPYLGPMTVLMVYEFFMFVAGIVGVIFLFAQRKRIRFAQGMLPPPKKGRIANVFLNAGVATALTVFTVIFLLSLV